MKILEYEFSEKYWNFQKVEFQNINLIVGDSGAGKTRLLNTLFNLGSQVAKSNLIGVGHWGIKLSLEEDIYDWKVSTTTEKNQAFVVEEQLSLNTKLILERKGVECTFDGGISRNLPKNEMSISNLREEELIKPLYEGFSKMLRRRFFSDELEKISNFWLANQRALMKIGETRDLFELYKVDPPLNYRLFVLKKYFPKIYTKIVSTYKEVFRFIDDVEIKNSDDLQNTGIPFSGIPIFCIKEQNVAKWLRVDELSSGMQKVLLIITDLYALPKDVVYMIDEYENSLGVSAINILPEILFSGEVPFQVFVTSHHPYIIKNFPVEYWYIAHRNGSNVEFEYGKELISRYKVSNQDQYTQLINDPIYSEGVE
jgi:predicted ATPase